MAFRFRIFPGSIGTGGVRVGPRAMGVRVGSKSAGINGSVGPFFYNKRARYRKGARKQVGCLQILMLPFILAAYLVFGVFWVPYKIIQAIVRENERRKARRPNNLSTKGQAKATHLRVWKDYVEWVWDGKRWNPDPPVTLHAGWWFQWSGDGWVPISEVTSNEPSPQARPTKCTDVTKPTVSPSRGVICPPRRGGILVPCPHRTVASSSSAATHGFGAGTDGLRAHQRAASALT